MTIIGCDPGKNGGIEWITDDGKACAEKMPETIKDLWELIQSIKCTHSLSDALLIAEYGRKMNL